MVGMLLFFSRPLVLPATTLVVSSLLALACGPVDEPVYDDELGLQAVATEPGSFAGAFIQKHSITTLADIPALEDPTAGGESYYLVERTPVIDDDTYTQVVTLCGGRLYDTAGTVSTITPDRWRMMAPSTEEVVAIDHAMGTFEVTRHVELWAIDLPDPYNTPMPADANEARQSPHAGRILDPDNDGNDGLTMSLDGLASGDVYFMQRKKVDLAGLIVSDDKATGLVSAYSYEQIVLGASNELLNRQLPRSPSPNPKDAWFEEVRLGATGTCDDVMSAVADQVVSRVNPFL